MLKINKGFSPEDKGELYRVTDVIFQRIKSPFLFSLFLSWPLINWKIIVVLFGHGSYHNKLKYIDEEILFNSWDETTFLLPLITATFYTFMWPIINGVFERIVFCIEIMNKKMEFKLRRLEPFDSSEQKKYFDTWDKELSKILNDERKYEVLYNESKAKLNSKINILATQKSQYILELLSFKSGFMSHNLSFLFSNSPSDAISTQNISSLIDEIKDLSIFYQAISNAPILNDYSREFTESELRVIYASDWIERKWDLMVALGIASTNYDGELKLVIGQQGYRMLNNAFSIDEELRIRL